MDTRPSPDHSGGPKPFCDLTDLTIAEEARLRTVGLFCCYVTEKPHMDSYLVPTKATASSPIPMPIPNHSSGPPTQNASSQPLSAGTKRWSQSTSGRLWRRCFGFIWHPRANVARVLFYIFLVIFLVEPLAGHERAT